MGMRFQEWKGFIITSITAQFYFGVLANYAILKPGIGEEFGFSESYFGKDFLIHRFSGNDKHVHESYWSNLSLDRKKNQTSLFYLH